MTQNCIGFSGVIFHLLVLETHHSTTTTTNNAANDNNRTRNVFGLFEVSSKAYPYALLVAIQFIMPHVSFLGHLSGIIIGTMQCHGVLDRLFPSYERLREWEILGNSSSNENNGRGSTVSALFVTAARTSW
jgi:rhomboid domain-containing protein 1